MAIKTSRFVVVLMMMGAACAARGQEVKRVELGEGQVLEMILVKAGSFVMGSPEGEKGRRADEGPVEKKVAEDFYLGKGPVTRGQFARFVAAAGYRTEAEVGTSGGYGVVDGKLVQKKEFSWRNTGFVQGDDHPVVCVTVKDANAFISWAGQRAGAKMSLPTEAQWEYACRAGTATRFYSGEEDADADGIAWHRGNAEGATHAVGQKTANAWGFVDMGGNVWEWCRDTYGAYEGGSVVGDMNQARNVLRGGSFLRGREDVRSAARYRSAPASRNGDTGFRVVMAVGAAAAPVAPARGEVAPVVPPPAVEIEPRVPVEAPAVPAPLGRAPAAPQAMEYQSNFLGGGVLSLVCMAVPCAGILAVIFFVVKMVNRGRGVGGGVDPMRPRPVGNLAQPRVVQDGFWVDTNQYSAGDRVRYRYQGPGGWVENDFIVEPGSQGQFIYTGHSPVNLALLGMMAAEAMRERDVPPPVPPVTHQPPTTRSSSSFRGYPSAY